MNKMRVAKFSIIITILMTSVIYKKPITVWGNTDSTIQVTTTQDALANDGLCSLREAIHAANLDTPVGGCTAGTGVDTIELEAGLYRLEIAGINEDSGLSGDLDIMKDLYLIGQGMGVTILDGNGLDRVLHNLQPESRVLIHDLTIQGGAAAISDLLGGGGILSLGNLSLTRVELLDNTAVRGGGVRNSQGVLHIRDSRIEGNQAFSEGGGVYGDGYLSISRTEILGNQAESGGGVNSDDAITLNDVSFTQNIATRYGGGFFNDSDADVQGTLFEGNEAPHGAGVYNKQTMSLQNVTFSSNISERGEGLVAQGGAIFNDASLEILHATFYANEAEQGGGTFNTENGDIAIKASILASSMGGNCINFGLFTSQGYNISDDGLCNLDSYGDRSNTDPLLEELDNNLGFTRTHAFQTSSPALDSVPVSDCQETDQRGVLRPIDGDRDSVAACDIGAYEFAPGGILQFSPTQGFVDESAGNQELWVSRTGGDGAIGISYQAGYGSASFDMDYHVVPGSLSWTSSSFSPKSIAIEIIDDIYCEADETGIVYLYAPTGQAGLLTPNDKFQLVILANDPDGPPQPGGPVFLPLITH